jgi:thioredoxin-related protein
MLPLALALASCGTSEPSASSDPAKPADFGPTGIPPHLRGKSDETGTRVKPGGKPTDLAGYRSTPLEDIVFTGDSDQLPELAGVFAAPKAKTWEQSDALARARAAREGKPVLIWFTSARNSALCKALGDELFADPKFEAWAAEKLIRLQIEHGARVDDPNLSMGQTRNREIDIERYVETMKKRYKVLGYPTLVMLSPSGEVLGRYSGYRRGTADFLWGQLKHAESVASRADGDWRKSMEAKGYREWQDPKGRKIFARLDSYRNGELVLIDPDGSRFRTRETQLSTADQDWIAEQKKLRSIR